MKLEPGSAHFKPAALVKDVPTIISGIENGAISGALRETKKRCRGSDYGCARLLIEACQGSERDRLRILLNDVLSGYPHIIWAIPSIICHQASFDKMAPLPVLDYQDYPEGARWAGWLPLRDVLRTSSQDAPSVLTNRPEVVLLLVQTDDEVAPQLDSRWLVSLFSNTATGECVHFTSAPGSDGVLPYLEGIEAGFLLNCLLRGNMAEAEAPRYFLQDPGALAMHDAFERYRRASPIRTQAAL